MVPAGILLFFSLLMISGTRTKKKPMKSQQKAIVEDF